MRLIKKSDNEVAIQGPRTLSLVVRAKRIVSVRIVASRQEMLQDMHWKGEVYVSTYDKVGCTLSPIDVLTTSTHFAASHKLRYSTTKKQSDAHSVPSHGSWNHSWKLTFTHN